MAEINWRLAQTPDYFGGMIRAQEAGQARRAEEAKARAYMTYAQDPQAGIQEIMAVDPSAGIQIQNAQAERARWAAQDARNARLDAQPKFIETTDGIYQASPDGKVSLALALPKKPDGPNWKERTLPDGSTEWFDINAMLPGAAQPQNAPQPQSATNWLAGVSQAAPDAQVTSGYRTPERNARVGGVPTSRHLDGQAVDLVPRPGESMAQLYMRVAQAPGVKAINEGDHVHVQSTAPRVVKGSAPKPKEQWVQLPDGRQKNTLTGKIEGTAATAARAAAGRPIPAPIVTGYAANSTALGKIDAAIAALEAHPSAVGLKRAAGDTINQRMDPKGIDARAAIADIGSQKIHDRSGAAVTAAESPRLMPFVPSVTDSKDAALKKLKRLKQEYLSNNSQIEAQYGPESGYQPLRSTPAPSAQSGGAPTVLRFDARGNRIQ